MNRIKIIFMSISLIALLFASCTKQEALNISDLPETYGTQPIPNVPVTKNYVIGCFYNNYTSWPTTVKRVPVVLPYINENTGGSNDLNNCFGPVVWKGVPVNVMQQQITMAKGAVDFWTFQYRSLTDTSTKAGAVRNNNKSDTALIKSFLAAANAGDMKFACRYEFNYSLFGGVSFNGAAPNNPASLTPANALDGSNRTVQMKNFVKDFLGMAKFFRFNNYLKVGNKYVVYIHNAQNIYVSNAATLYKRVRDTVRYTYGVELYLVGSMPNNSTAIGLPPEVFMTNFRGIQNGVEDGLDAIYEDRTNGSLQNTVGWSVYWLYAPYCSAYFKFCSQYVAPYHLNYMPSFMPAYDPRVKSPTGSSPVFNRKDTAFFHKMANVCKLYADTTRIINLDSWNTWDEDSQLEPSLDEGDLYLKMVKSEFKLPSSN